MGEPCGIYKRDTDPPDKSCVKGFWFEHHNDKNNYVILKNNYSYIVHLVDTHRKSPFQLFNAIFMMLCGLPWKSF